eukprot:TRINITY_DN42556_c0_g1_i1.p1 TRINITY_DN42556_c0_g1~~TRINITY_DN42556_c0_g1_i1.p1  ORF type:complete len:329 (+),score=77.62 TRINITY_DN42556_c0_g1_i1:160-1146(+)
MPQCCALLIDAENLSTAGDPKFLLDAILQELHSLFDCRVIVKRAYGDFSSPGLRKWQPALRDARVKQVPPTGERGKKACDMLLVVDAMDLMHQTSNLDIFCLATSDADFAPLADRLREASKLVYGIGFAQRSAQAFVKACHRFVAVENLLQNLLPKSTPALQNMAQPAEDARKPDHPGQPADAKKRAKAAVKLLAATRQQKDGFVQCSTVNDYLKCQDRSWHVQSWGYTNIREFFDGVPGLETAALPQGGQHSKLNTFVRLHKTARNIKSKKIPKTDGEVSSSVKVKRVVRRKRKASEAAKQPAVPLGGGHALDAMPSEILSAKAEGG